ncbi:hypothetical protein D3C81_1891100 [compost metagenome]
MFLRFARRLEQGFPQGRRLGFAGADQPVFHARFGGGKTCRRQRLVALRRQLAQLSYECRLAHRELRDRIDVSRNQMPLFFFHQCQQCGHELLLVAQAGKRSH